MTAPLVIWCENGSFQVNIWGNVMSGLVAFCTAPYGVCPFLTGLVPALILTVGGHDTQVYKVKM